MPKSSFCPDRHKQLMTENEEYRKGYEYAAECVRTMKIPHYELKKMAFIFLDFKQLNAAGMAYCYWELGNAPAAVA